MIFLFFSVQTCNANTSCVYSTLLADLPRYLGICFDVFGIPEKKVYQGVAFTNSDYGGKKPNGSRIVFVNGEGIAVSRQGHVGFFDRDFYLAIATY